MGIFNTFALTIIKLHNIISNMLGGYHLIFGPITLAIKLFCFIVLILSNLKSQSYFQEIDSLISLNRTAADLRQFDKAIQHIDHAIELTTQHLDTNDLRTGICLANKARTVHMMGTHAEADIVYKKALKIEKLYIITHPKEYCVTAQNYSRLLISKANYDQATTYLKEIRSIRLKNPGKKSIEYALATSFLAEVYNLKNKRKEAEKLFNESIKSPSVKTAYEYALISNKFGNYYFQLKNYQKAEPLYLKARELFYKLKGPENQEYAICTNNLGSLYLERDEYSKAGPLLKESKRIFDNKNDSLSNNYLLCINNLASFYSQIGEYKMANQLYIKVKEIREKKPTIDVSNYAKCLFNLAALNYKLENYFLAIDFHTKSMEALKQIQADSSEDYARNLDGLANTYQAIGSYTTSEKLYLQALNLLEQTIGTRNAIYNTSLYNITNLYFDWKAYEKAEPLLTNTLKIQKRIQGNKSLDYARTLSLFADLLVLQEKIPEALTSYESIMNIYSRYYSKDNINYSKMATRQAHVLILAKRLKDAGILLQKNKQIIYESLGYRSLDYLQVLQEQLLLAKANNDQHETKKYYLEINQILKELISNTGAFLSEAELEAYISLFKESLDQFNSYGMLVGNQDPEIANQMFLNAVFYKGFVLQELKKARIKLNNNPVVSEKLNQLRSLKFEISQIQLAHNKQPAKLNELMVLSEQAEKEIKQFIPVDSKSNQNLNLSDFQQKIQIGDLLIEFIKFKVATLTGQDSSRFAALVFKSNDQFVTPIDLVAEQELAPFFKEYGSSQNDFIQKIYSSKKRGLIPIESKGKSFYDLIWEPLERSLDQVKRIFFSPIGALHQLNLSALSNDQELILGERYDMVQVNSCRDLFSEPLQYPDSNKALLFGGIQFSDQLPEKQRSTIAGPWNDLKWTLQETRSIDELLTGQAFQTELFTGSQASETQLKSCLTKTNYKIVHLATHGFFYHKADYKDQKVINEHNPDLSTRIKQLNNPMMRSGVLLAGANNSWTSNFTTLNGIDDGILTAYELSELNLQQTDLVVLSACETGLGDIKDAEGVFGLQRALKIAGCKHQIISLWQIPDKETSNFMITFYKNWNIHKVTIHDAFRKTQHEMRERYENPYQWAGFVLIQ